MGGIIEDRIFQVLGRNRLDGSEIAERLRSIGCKRKYGTIAHHLRKMAYLQQLSREKVGGEYEYWNRCREN